MKPPLTLLIVDDEESVRTVCARAIGPADGMAVITASDGKEALARLEKDRFDVLLTDLVMEPVDGFKLIETARRKYPEMDVIVMTGYSTFDHVVRAIKLGASDFILKPMEILLLKAALRRCAERRALQARVSELERKLAERP